VKKSYGAVMLLAVLMAAVLLPNPVSAVLLGENITIYDGVTGVPGVGMLWGQESATTGLGVGREDQEGEPHEYNTGAGQSWDLEAMFLDGTALYVVGGYDFVTYSQGLRSDGAPAYRAPGSIFLDITGDAGVGGAANEYGYEYAINLDFGALTYDVVDLGQGPPGTFGGTTVVPYSSPWNLTSGGLVVASDAAFVPYQLDDMSWWQYHTGLPDAEFDSLVGGTHWVFGVDLGFISTPTGPQEFTARLTMNCGNDNLVGYHRPFNIPDGGATGVLLGMALCGVGLWRRRLG